MIETLLRDPNAVYVTLILAIWLAVTSAHMPGTGILEVLAVGGLGASVMLLASMPTNWTAVLLLVIGVLIFIIVPFIKQQYTTFSLSGLVLQAAGGALLFSEQPVSLPTIAVTVVLSLAYHFFILLPALRNMSTEPALTREDTIIGAVGRVVTALDPIGTVYAGGENWSATGSERLQPGEQIVVVDREGLQLIVESVKRKAMPHEPAPGETETGQAQQPG